MFGAGGEARFAADDRSPDAEPGLGTLSAVDEPVSAGDVGRPPAGAGDRIEAVELQVRQLTSRLAGWVEAQLVQALEDRRSDMKALRAELQVVVGENLAALRAETSSVLSVATRRLELAQEQLGERLDTVGERAADTATRIVALTGTSSTEGERLAIVEQQVTQRLTLAHEEVAAALIAAEDRRQADLAALRAELAEVGAGAGPARIDMFEQRVKAAMGRLAESFETQLAELAAGRDSGLDALRAEVTGVVAAAERDAADRTEMLEKVRNEAAARSAERIEARLAQIVAEREVLADTLRAELATAREAEVEEQRADRVATAAAIGERVDATAMRAAAVADRVSELQAGADAAAALAEELEQRVKAAVGRLAESVEERLAEVAAVQSAQRRTEIDTAAAALRARLAQVQERVDAADEARRESEARVGGLVEAKLDEVVGRRQAELEALRAELQEALDVQLRQARSEIGTAVADAHRRFVVSVDNLHERMNIVADQATSAHAAVAGMETLDETVASDGRRIEALELHTRRTDARLEDVVDAKLAELAGRRSAELDARLAEFAGQRGAELAGAQAQLRAALDAHLAETRAEVTSAVNAGRAELLERSARLEERQASLDSQAAQAVAGLDDLAAAVDVALRDAEERLGERVQAQLAVVEAAAAEVAGERSEMAASTASLTRKVARLQDQVQKKVAGVVEQVDGLARAAASDAGSLAPLRSDLRFVQTQVAQLSEAVAELRPRRQPAPARKAAPAKKAAPRKAAPAPAKATRRRRDQ